MEPLCSLLVAGKRDLEGRGVSDVAGFLGHVQLVGGQPAPPVRAEVRVGGRGGGAWHPEQLAEADVVLPQSLALVCGEPSDDYFYESFGDRDELLLAVFDRIAEEAAATVLEAGGRAPDDARLKARAAISAFVALVTDDRRKVRVLFVEAVGSEALARRRFETLRMFSHLVAGHARDFYGIKDGADTLVEMSALMIVGGLAETLLAWLDGTLSVTREQLIEDCADLFVATGHGAVALARARAAAK